MIFPCATPPNRCGDPPLANLTSEEDDGPTFIGFNTGDGLVPPLGSDWVDPNGFSFCQARSQADADTCALNNQFVDQVNNSDHGGGSWTDPTGNPYPIFVNAEVSYTASCPDGSPFVFTVPAGRYKALSQVEADRIAASFAQIEANLNKVCLGTFNPRGCLNTAFSGSVGVNGRGTFTFSIFAGSLPPGIALSSGGARTAVFSGTPTAAGNYTFTLMAENALGYFMRKSYTFQVLGITTASPLPSYTQNTAYSQQLAAAGGSTPYTFTITAGSLPTGLSLSTSGLISGTPTDSMSFSFTVQVSDANGTACAKSFEIDAATAAGLVLYYKLDELTGTRKDCHSCADKVNCNTCPSANNLSEIEGPVGNAAGIINQGALFTGGVLAGNFLRGSTPLDMSQDFTISLWTKPAGVNGLFFDNFDPATNIGQFAIVDAAPVNTGFASTFAQSGAGVSTIFFTATDGVLNHLVFTWRAATGTLTGYHNGVLENTTSNLAPIATTFGAPQIGGSPSNPFRYGGLVDEVGIWNRVLSASEISALYNGGAGLPLTAANFPP